MEEIIHKIQRETIGLNWLNDTLELLLIFFAVNYTSESHYTLMAFRDLWGSVRVRNHNIRNIRNIRNGAFWDPMENRNIRNIRNGALWAEVVPMMSCTRQK